MAVQECRRFKKLMEKRLYDRWSENTMNNQYILKMLENGKIEELKKAVQDEIYKKELSATPGAIQRYAAMKRYFKYADGIDKRVSMPCIINDKACFVNRFTAIKTSESIGDITPYEGKYFNLDIVMNVEKNMEYTEEVDFNRILAEAKSKGYKFKKNEIVQGSNFTTVFFYNGAYFKVGLMDQAFSIINDGEKAKVYSSGKATEPIKIITSIGECILLPVKFKKDKCDEKIVINVVSKHYKDIE